MTEHADPTLLVPAGQRQVTSNGNGQIGRSGTGFGFFMPSGASVLRNRQLARPLTVRAIREHAARIGPWNQLRLFVVLPFHDAVRTAVPVATLTPHDVIPEPARRRAHDLRVVTADLIGEHAGRAAERAGRLPVPVLLSAAPGVGVAATVGDERCVLDHLSDHGPVFIGKGRELFVTVAGSGHYLKWHRSLDGAAEALVELVETVNSHARTFEAAEHNLSAEHLEGRPLVQIKALTGRPLTKHDVDHLARALGELHAATASGEISVGEATWELGTVTTTDLIGHLDGTATAACVHGDMCIANTRIRSDGTVQIFDWDLGSSAGAAEVDAALLLLREDSATKDTLVAYEAAAGLPIRGEHVEAAGRMLLSRWGPKILGRLQTRAAALFGAAILLDRHLPEMAGAQQ